MKKYSVYVKFVNGEDILIETDTNIDNIEIIDVGGQKTMIIDDVGYTLNLNNVEEINQVKLR